VRISGYPYAVSTTEDGKEVGLTAGEAARQLGVAVTTLRTWHRRYGLGPSGHEHGRHRRYRSEDLARLATMRTLIAQGMTAAEAARLTLAGVGAPVAAADAGRAPARAVSGLFDTAVRLDADGVRRLVRRALGEWGVVRAWQHLICPVLVEIGDRHAGTGELIEVEHLLSRTISEELAIVARPGPGVPAKILLACADEEQHSLPLEALAAAAAERGLRCRLLGARVPPVALLAAVRRTGPTLVVVWSHAPETADPAQLRALRDGAGQGLLLAAAGPGWGDDLPAGTLTLATFAEAVELMVAAAGTG
jgi:DNA-binding transcriptional MerR regulator